MLDGGRAITFRVAVPAMLAVTVVAFACGSSSVASVQNAGKPLRWVALFALLGLALAWAAASGMRPPALPATVLALAGLLVGLMLVSSLWSVDPRLTFARAVSLTAVLLTAATLAHIGATVPGAFERILAAVVAGAAIVALAGLLVLAVDHGAAVEAATRDLPARYRGLGENPDTVSLLLALCFPLLAVALLRARGWRPLALVVALILLFDGSVVASSSRGSLIAGFGGVLAVTLLAPVPARMRALGTAGGVALLAVSLGIALSPVSKRAPAASASPSASPPAQSQSQPQQPAPKPSPYVDVEGPLPLDSDVGAPIIGEGNGNPRPLFGLSGRGIAWRGALDQADQRPVLGYGFGTEDHVFVDRFTTFVSSVVENSYLGIYLQLGAVGLAVLLALLLALAVAAVRARAGWHSLAPLGVLVVALLLAFVQSYLYSAGNIGTLTVWAAGFLGAAMVVRQRARE